LGDLPNDLADFTGDYESQSYWAHFEIREGQLAGELSGQPFKLQRTAALKFTLDSRIDDGAKVAFARGESGAVTGFSLGIQQFARAPKKPAPLPEEWKKVLGTYGPDFIPIVISTRHGHLYAMTENMVDYRLTPINRRVCALPPGMYADEEVVFLSDADGGIRAIDFANMVLPVRP
ncbi:MAG: hypothetical protein ABI680_10265, partial [Chthoniobacteraceae bacterium]